MSKSVDTPTVEISEICPEKNAYKWTWEVFSNYCGNDFVSINDKLSITVGSEHGILAYNTLFWNSINKGEFDHLTILNDNGFVCYDDGRIDYFMTAFYFINTLFERDSNVVRDELNRIDYHHSIWVKRNLKVDQPFVNNCFNALAQLLELDLKKRRTQLWFSHDIDSVYGAYRQDGKWLLKNGKLFAFIRQLLLPLFGKIEWMNLAKIAALESKRGVKSTFFLLTEKGQVNKRAYNSDYSIEDKRIQREINELVKSSNEIGLHKSLSQLTYAEEIKKIGIPVWANRNHFLLMKWNDDLKAQIEVGIKVDASLGYAEHYGFRNGYSLPFYPFDIETKTVLPILEIPLNIMDGTFSSYMNKTADEGYDLVHHFIENNRENAVISILWHNSHFTDYKYKGFPKMYERLLKLTQNGLVDVVDLTTLTQHYSFESIHNS